MHRIHLQDGEDFYEAARKLVSVGSEDGPVEFLRGGVVVATHPRLYRAAAVEVREEPSLHISKWKPHYKAVVSQKLLSVIEAEHTKMRQEKKV